MQAVNETGVLGRQVDIPTDPISYKLDVIPNPHPGRLYFVRFTIPEFTSLCPKTGQPDFATITIDFMPREHLVESKSLKLYMFAFRNHGAYHEDVTGSIHHALVQAIKPHWLRTSGIFNPRGGIPIDVWHHFGDVPGQIPNHAIPPMPAPNFEGR